MEFKTFLRLIFVITSALVRIISCSELADGHHSDHHHHEVEELTPKLNVTVPESSGCHDDCVEFGYCEEGHVENVKEDFQEEDETCRQCIIDTCYNHLKKSLFHDCVHTARTKTCASAHCTAVAHDHLEEYKKCDCCIKQCEENDFNPEKCREDDKGHGSHDHNHNNDLSSSVHGFHSPRSHSPGEILSSEHESRKREDKLSHSENLKEESSGLKHSSYNEEEHSPHTFAVSHSGIGESLEYTSRDHKEQDLKHSPDGHVETESVDIEEESSYHNPHDHTKEESSGHIPQGHSGEESSAHTTHGYAKEKSSKHSPHNHSEEESSGHIPQGHSEEEESSVHSPHGHAEEESFEHSPHGHAEEESSEHSPQHSHEGGISEHDKGDDSPHLVDDHHSSHHNHDVFTHSAENEILNHCVSQCQSSNSCPMNPAMHAMLNDRTCDECVHEICADKLQEDFIPCHVSAYKECLKNAKCLISNPLYVHWLINCQECVDSCVDGVLLPKVNVHKKHSKCLKGCNMCETERAKAKKWKITTHECKQCVFEECLFNKFSSNCYERAVMGCSTCPKPGPSFFISSIKCMKCRMQCLADVPKTNTCLRNCKATFQCPLDKFTCNKCKQMKCTVGDTKCNKKYKENCLPCESEHRMEKCNQCYSLCSFKRHANR